MADNRLKRIAIVGASGNVGGSVLKHLLEINPDVAVTIVTRADSKARFPQSSQITVKKGSYEDASFLQSAFSDVDLALFTVAFMGGQNAQTPLIDAAAKAGVKWIVPNEYAGDGLNENLFTSVPLFREKAAARKQIEDLSKTHEGLKWIGVATNPWTEMSIQSGLFGFNVSERRATLYAGSGNFNSSSQNQVGRGIARLLSLPVTDLSNPRASLQHYANNYAYISSFSISQSKLFDAIQRVTGTSKSDWTVEDSSIDGWIKDASAKFAAGDFFAGASLAYAYYMGDGLGGDFETKAKEDRAALGLQEESLDDIVRGALAAPGQ